VTNVVYINCSFKLLKLSGFYRLFYQPVCSIFIVDAGGIGVIDVAVIDPTGRKDVIRPMVARKADDNWYVEYTPLVEGPHSVNIFFAGKPIANSPFPVAVSQG